MIYLLVWPEHLEAAARLAAPLSSALEGRMQVMATSQLAGRDVAPFGTYVFTGVSCLTGAMRERFLLLERALEAGGATLVNRPSQAKPSDAMLIEAGGVEIGRAAEIKSWGKFPAMLNSQTATFSLDSPLLLDAAQMKESLGRMVLSGCPPESLWVRSSPALADRRRQMLAVLRLGDRLYPAGADSLGQDVLDRALSLCRDLAPAASLTTFWLSSGTLVPWQVEDSAPAVLSGADQSGASFLAIADAWKQLLPTEKPVGSIKLR